MPRRAQNEEPSLDPLPRTPPAQAAASPTASTSELRTELRPKDGAGAAIGGSAAWGVRAPRFGTTARRITLAILVTALLPFIAAVWVGKTTIDRLGALATQPELGAALEGALGVYGDLAVALKDGMRHEVAAMAASPELIQAAVTADAADDERALRAVAASHPRTASLLLETPTRTSSVEPSTPDVDPGAKRLTVRAPVPGTSAVLTAVLQTPGTRFAEQESLAGFVRAYQELESTRRSAYVETPHLAAVTLVMLATIVLAIMAGILVARPVARGVERLDEALRAVAAGDLKPRVQFDAADELGALGRAFNAAILELDHSRARIEFLRHMGEWQTIARRLAHEIRNPLTPIQLAVQECHRRYDGSDAEFARLLGTTVEVVEEEVASLRRLVGRFARFARLPEPELTPCDLTELLREQGAHLAMTDRVSATGGDDEEPALVGVDLEVELPPRPLPARIDREMFHRALLNLVRNAAQAIQAAPRLMEEGGGPRAPGSPGKVSTGRVRIRAGEDAEGLWVAVDDDGPGIEPGVQATLFDPYVTTKRDGTGLGLSIVKKIVLDHGGRVEATTSPEGGARILLRFPRSTESAVPASTTSADGTTSPASVPG